MFKNKQKQPAKSPKNNEITAGFSDLYVNNNINKLQAKTAVNNTGEIRINTN